MRFNRTFVVAGCSTFLLVTLSGASRVAAQDSLQAVKELYASAAYEDALTAVGKIDSPAEPNIEAEQYRVFCLVALGRMDEAAQAVESVLTLRPEYRPDAADASPRIQSLFSQVRRRIGPALVKRLYQQGRAAMERKDREEAVAQFEAMLRVANDEDVRNEASVAELKELGSGFLELSKALPAKPKPADPPPVVVAARPSVISPPVVIQQRLPPWIPDPVSRATEFRGSVRVQISAEGKVTNAEILKSVHPAYDQSLLRAAKGWLYEPAKKDGVAIPSEKTVEVAVTPPAPKPGANSGADKSLPF
jgi:TonB family protein